VATLRAPMRSMPQDWFCKTVLQEALDVVDAVEQQRPVPSHDDQHSDLFCVPRPHRPARESVPHLGLLWDMTATLCTIEPYSQTPSVVSLRELSRKQLNLHRQLCKQERDDQRAVAPLWVISPGVPVSGLAVLSAAPDPEYPVGFYRSGELLNLRIVVLSELPLSSETRLLRLLGPPEMRQRAREEIAALAPDDPARQPWVELIEKLVYLLVKEPDAAKEEEVDMTKLGQEFEQFKSELRREAAARAKAEVFLAILSARGVMVNDMVRQKIMACTDLAALDRWTVQAATATSPADVLAAAA